MSKVSTANSIISANDLLSGAVVYLDQQEQWTSDPSAARVFGASKETEAWLATQQDANWLTSVVSVVVEAASVQGSQLETPAMRALIRRHGPTIQQTWQRAA